MSGDSCKVAYQIVFYGNTCAIQLPRFSLAMNGSVLEYPSICVYKGHKHNCGDLWEAAFPSSGIVSRVHSSTDDFTKCVFSTFKDKLRAFVNKDLDGAALIEERLLISDKGQLCKAFNHVKVQVPLEQNERKKLQLLQTNFADKLTKLKEVNQALTK